MSDLENENVENTTSNEANSETNENLNNEQATEESEFVTKLKNLNETKDSTEEFTKEDVEQNKIFAFFSYFSWLVLVPLLGTKSKFARFHANQGIILAIVETIWWVIEVILTKLLFPIPVIGLLVSLILSLSNLVFLVLVIIGVINVVNGRAKELPIIGKYKILK